MYNGKDQGCHRQRFDGLIQHILLQPTYVRNHTPRQGTIGCSERKKHFLTMLIEVRTKNLLKAKFRYIPFGRDQVLKCLIDILPKGNLPKDPFDCQWVPAHSARIFNKYV